MHQPVAHVISSMRSSSSSASQMCPIVSSIKSSRSFSVRNGNVVSPEKSNSIFVTWNCMVPCVDEHSIQPIQSSQCSYGHFPDWHRVRSLLIWFQAALKVFLLPICRPWWIIHHPFALLRDLVRKGKIAHIPLSINTGCGSR